MRPATEGQAARQRLRGGAPPVEVIGYDGRDDRRRLFPLVAYAVCHASCLRTLRANRSGSLPSGPDHESCGANFRARAFWVVFAPVGRSSDATCHQGQAAVAAGDGVPVRFALKALRFRRAAERLAANQRIGRDR